eukprot:scaffold31776_cov45-Attheya_sp.AAC.1
MSKSSHQQKYPYQVDYNDHFETPIVAYKDILPLIDLTLQKNQDESGSRLSNPIDAPLDTTNVSKKKQLLKKDRKRLAKQKAFQEPQEDGEDGESKSIADDEGEPTRRNDDLVMERRRCGVIYDPYYCNGRVVDLLRQLGFREIRHERRDFYADVAQEKVPLHDVLITNPPYSTNHKEQCLEFCVKKLRQTGTPFFLLLPNYVALKEYYRHATQTKDGNEANDIVYVVPPDPYEYDHPEGTGHDIPPFSSIWFCGIGKTHMETLRMKKSLYLEKLNDESVSRGRGRVSIAFSIQELQQLNAVPTLKRLNPRQRKKRKQQKEEHYNSATTSTLNTESKTKACTNTSKNINQGQIMLEITKNPTPKKNSSHRDANGVRKKKRF